MPETRPAQEKSPGAVFLHRGIFPHLGPAGLRGYVTDTETVSLVREVKLSPE